MSVRTEVELAVHQAAVRARSAAHEIALASRAVKDAALLAMADALQKGRLGVMDYLNLKNLQADTDMRKGLGGIQEEDKKE